MVDRWFGELMETLRLSGRLEDTVVAVISDHGHNLGIDPGDKGLVSKQGHPMTRAVADLVLMVRHPGGEHAGAECGQLVYNLDLTPTMLGIAGEQMPLPVDGIDAWGSVAAGSAFLRDHITIGWGPLVTVITDEWWLNASIWGEAPLLYTVKDDPNLERNLAPERPELCAALLRLAVEDAGGSIPEAFARYHDKPGCTPFEVRYATLRKAL
jgi:arylsulfatase A-like enzyme